MTKKEKPPRLRLRGVRLPEEPKRRKKKFLRIPGRLERNKEEKPKKALIKIPVKPTPEKAETQPQLIPSKPKELAFDALKPEEIEKILAGMTPQEPKTIETKIRQGKWKQALPALKKLFLHSIHDWDWKTITSIFAILIVVSLAGLVSYKVYQSIHTWREDAQNITVPESEIYHPQKLESEKVIDQFTQKVNKEYAKEKGLAEEEALKKGMEEKSKEFKAKGSQLYT